MGWKQNFYGQEFVFSQLIDSLINKATCELILIRLGKNKQFYPYNINPLGSLLIPTAGGPNIEEGLKLLPAFLEVYNQEKLPPIWLTKVYPPEAKDFNSNQLYTTTKKLQNLLNTEVQSLTVCSTSVVSAVIQLAETQKSELVILGASRDSLLKQAWYGNIPEAITSKLDTTVIIIRLPS